MNQYVLKVGADIASEWFDVCLMLDEKPQFRKFDNDFSGFTKALRWFQSFSPDSIELVLEPTGRYGEWLSEFMHANGVRVLQAQPLLLRRYAESLDLRGKSDHKDCLALCKYAHERGNKIREWQPKTDLELELRDMQVLLRSIGKRRVVIKCQLECKLRSEYVRQALLAELEQVEKSFDEALKRSHLLIKQNDRLSKDLEFIDSIPGIGLQTAILLVTMIDFRKFKSARAVACFLGLTKKKHQSGTSIRGDEGMSKRGNTFIRSSLFMPARASVQNDEVSAALYQRLRLKGSLDVQAQVAVIRRMVTIAWALVKNQKPFDHNHVAAYRHQEATV
ncbi:MAG: IS110 family transposase [Candidatus Obscuribacterales bacterium]|nr:IS110 family transposase [Candidatus Obscuribacterales bacterium]